MAPAQRFTFLGLLAAAAYLFWLTAEPLRVPLFLGLLVAIGMYPLHDRLVAHSPRRAAISAAVLTALVLLLTLVVAGFVLALVSAELVQVAQSAREHYQHGGTAELLGPRLHAFFVSLGLHPDTLAQRLSAAAEAMAGDVARATGAVVAFSVSGIIVLIFTALTSYYLLREGRRIVAWLTEVLPLPEAQFRELTRDFRDVTRAMLLGTGVTALYQAVAAFIGYSMLLVPRPLLWAALTGVASLVPAVGTALIWAPMAVWLILGGAVVRGPLLIAWGALIIVGVGNYVLQPRLLGSRVRMNELLVFVALFGGVQAFGLLGIILGPIVTALFVALVRIWQREYRPQEMR